MASSAVEELVEASSQGNLQIITDIVEANGMDLIHHKNKEGEPAICKACYYGQDDAVRLLLKLGADIESRTNQFQNTCLHWASNQGRESTILILLNNGANLESKNLYGLTPLMSAGCKPRPSTVKLLLELGASTTNIMNQGSTALHLTSSYGMACNISLLIDYGSDLELLNDAGRTPLQSAARNGFDETIEVLLDKGAKVNTLGTDGDTALHWASVNGKETTVNLLLDRRADINCPNKDGKTALHLASIAGHLDVIKILLSRGAELDLQDKYGDPLLYPKPEVIQSSHPYKHNTSDYIKVEIPAANGYLVEFDEQTSLSSQHYISFYKNRTSKECWGEGKYTGGFGDTQKNFPGVNGKPALRIPSPSFFLHFFSGNDSVDWGFKCTVTPQFLNEDTDNDKNGWTPLMWAAFSGQTEAVRLLLESGGKVDVIDWCGNSALFLALQNLHQDSAIRLAESGSLLHTPNRLNLTPIELAIRDDQSSFIRAVMKLISFFTDENGSHLKMGFDFVWLQVLTLTESYLDEVCEVLDRNSTKVLQLAHLSDSCGRSAIYMARPVYLRAMMERLYFFKRYELHAGPPQHKSATCIVRIAIDHGSPDEPTEVALKFMINKDQFERELSVRTTANFNPEFVKTFCGYHNADEDPVFRKEVEAKGMYPYCLVMPAAERSLASVLAHEHIAGRDWDQLRAISVDIVKALNHIHSKKMIHGDVKPLNIMRAGGRYKFIDFDASVSIGGSDSYAGAKFSSAFIPPEMLALDDDSLIVRSFPVDPATGAVTFDNMPFLPLRADISYDMWSLGVVLFHMFTGEPLFKSNDEDNMNEDDMWDLFEWRNHLKSFHLLKIKNISARNLVGRLLSKNPKHRPDTNRVLAHPFLSGRKVARMVGEAASYDVFLSYRVASDAGVVETLYNDLTAAGLRVWWDRKCLIAGEKWEEGFCDGLIKSLVFVPVISEEGMFNPDNDWQNFARLREDSACDNVLLEYRLALEFKDMGLVEAISPVFVGSAVGTQSEDNRLSGFKKFSNHPTFLPQVAVSSIESKVRWHLDRQGLGEPLLHADTVDGICSKILSHQGGFVEGNGMQSLQNVCQTIKTTVMKTSLAFSTRGLTYHSHNNVDTLRADVLKLSKENHKLKYEELRTSYPFLNSSGNLTDNNHSRCMIS